MSEEQMVPAAEPTPATSGEAPKATTVDIVIPVYNEEKDLARSIATLSQFLVGLSADWSWRIVVADNAATDATLVIAQELATRWPDQVGYIHLDQKGRGRALRRAWSESRADICCYMDVDLSTGLDALPALVAALRGGYDVAIGSRLLPESRVVRGLKREFISRTYNQMIRLSHGVSFHDAQCGFKGVTRRAIEQLLPLAQDQAWFLDTELLLLAEAKGYRIKEIPVTWTDDPDSRVKIAKTAWEDIKGLWRLKWHMPPGGEIERAPDAGLNGAVAPRAGLSPWVAVVGAVAAVVGWLFLRGRRGGRGGGGLL
jgi:glycosyltransferase involved in cell wall biosynthesis